MRASALVPALLLAVASTFSSVAQQSSQAVLESNGSTGSCPIGLFAQRTSPVQISSASSQPRDLFGLGVHVTFVPQDTPTIRSVEVIVHGLDTRARALPAGSELSAPGTLAKTFHLTSQAGSPLTRADLWLANAGSLSSVELRAITYSNGTTWNSSSVARCSAIPSGILLIGQS